jgi:hypothetical protein
MADVKGPAIETGIGDDQLSRPVAGLFGLGRCQLQRAIGSLGITSPEGGILPFSPDHSVLLSRPQALRTHQPTHCGRSHSMPYSSGIESQSRSSGGRWSRSTRKSAGTPTLSNAAKSSAHSPGVGFSVSFMCVVTSPSSDVEPWYRGGTMGYESHRTGSHYRTWVVDNHVCN